DDPQQDDDRQRHLLGPHLADEPADGPAEVLRLLARHRSLAHAASSSLSWDRTISRYVSQSPISCPCVPRPTIRPSSRTTIWSESLIVETRWATTTVVAPAVIDGSAARSRASVAMSSAE